MKVGLLVCAIAVGAFGCSGAESCSVVGGSSQVRVVASNTVSLLTFCVNGQCLDSPAGSQATIGVGDRPEAYPYTVTGTNLTTGDPFGRSGVVKTQPFYPNGERCEPKLAGAVVLVEDSGDTVYPVSGI